MADFAKLLGDIQSGGGLLVVFALLMLEMRYLRRDVDHAHKRIDNVEARAAK